MRLPRFFVPDLPAEPGSLCVLEGDEATHLSRVLRLKVGAEVEAFDGRGGAGRFGVDTVDRRRAVLRLIERRDGGPALPFELTCAVATPKGKRSKRLVESLTELGVTAYAPLELERSSVKAPDVETARRWALEACKQSLRNTLPQVLPAMDLSGLIALAGEYELALLPDTQDAQPLREVIPPDPERSLLAVGPEGGFTDAERAALRSAGFRSVTLGPTVLRIETAAAAAVAALVVAWA